MPALGRPSARYTQMLAPSDFRRVEKGFANVRDALGEIDIIAHCHSEFDLPSAVGVAKAVAPVRPRWIEDALPVPYSDSWLALKRQSPVPILNGEKLELPRGFLPFLQNQALDVVHPDLAFCGGITSAKKIADIASLYRIPVATHNVGSLVLLMASIHFGAGIFDYVMSENALDKGQHVESMGMKPVEVKNSFIAVPTAPGLGLDLNPDFLKAHMAPGETWWG